MNKFVRGLCHVGKVVLKPFFPVKVYGEKSIENNKRCIIVGNHLSGWDPILFTVGTKGIHRFVYKAELSKNWFLRWVFNGLEFIPVHRGDVDLPSSRRILQLLGEDKSVALFPEGTRNPNVDCLQKFRTGAVLFALKTHSPLRPYYIWDKAKCFHKNYIIVGDEFTLKEFYDRPVDKDTLNQATEVIKQKIEALRIQLNEILDKKGIKRRKRTRKEIENTQRYNQRQNSLQKRLELQAAQNATEANANVVVEDKDTVAVNKESDQ